MNLIKKLSFLALASIVLPVYAQKSMTPDDLANWNRITQKEISNNGQWVGYKTSPWIGDATIYIRSIAGDNQFSVHPAGQMFFSSSSRYAVISRITAKAVSDSLKLRKTKKELMPLPQLLVYNLGGKVSYIDSVKNFAVADSADWLAYRRTSKDSTLYVRSLDGSRLLRFPNVSEYNFAKDNAHLWFVSAGDSANNVKAGLYSLNPTNNSATLIKEGKGKFVQAQFNEDGSDLAFLYCEQKDSVDKALDLWLSTKDEPAKMIASRGESFLPTGWIISQYGNVKFSKNGERLFFGTSPVPHETDTTELADNRPNVQVWTWDEPQQHTVQNFQLQRDLEKNYLAVYLINKGKAQQIETEDAPNSRMDKEGNAPFALLFNNKPYLVSSMWEGRVKKDYYALSIENGERRLLKNADYGTWSLSPEGNYAYWYSETDSSYYTAEMANGTIHRLTTPGTFAAWEKDNDVPDYPQAYGTTGWTKGDSEFLINNRYDIWRFDPKGTSAPVNLTVNGQTNNIIYKYTPINEEEENFDEEDYYSYPKVIDLNTPQLLTGTNEKTKTSSFFKADLSKAIAPTLLIGGYSRLTFVAKAKKSNATLFTSESFEQAPDLRVSDMNFKKSIQVSHIGDQQKKFIWGTAELVHWTSLDGRELDGILYKPSNFDPSKKYPMIVNFYERNSDDLYKYRTPEIHRSTIDYHLYLSNGYLVFNPDVRYKDGHPGESCYNCVMPGIASIVAKGFVNEKAIGAQGHSWGGYQVAYLATRTDKFAAIEAGAPVVNMFSAYGGIRWGSGMARSFQYEHTQSRIGGTPWTAPNLYKENSPLFNMDKVKTPILIMHNDADGHVPWYQGIEYFVSLRRLQKPAWLLDYVGEPHWPLKKANQKDFQTRMFQFFNHYLKGEAMPKWMKDGIPATEQSYKLGYGTDK